MTPEERFTKIENHLSALTEHQVRHAEEIEELRRMQKGVFVALGKNAEAQRITDETLQALIRKIDRITGNQTEN